MRLGGFLLIVFFVLFLTWMIIVQPTIGPKGTEPVNAALVEGLRNHVDFFARSLSPRNINNANALDGAANYIVSVLAEAGGRISEQRFQIASPDIARTTRAPAQYRNITASFGPEQGERIVIGAHYDVFGEFPGADDNASGVAGLLELGKRLGANPLPLRVDLVAWTLEEPPAYATPDMGSAVYAAALAKERADLRAVIVLECIGYFSDAPGSQSYPVKLLNLFYPSQANFIAVVGNLKSRALARSIKVAMQTATSLPVASLNAPAQIPGVDFSDHRSFWRYGWPAVMVTDTAFYRNANYHTAQDTPDTLDYARMGQVVQGVWQALVSLTR